MNAANRPTRRAVRQVQTIAVSAGEAATAATYTSRRRALALARTGTAGNPTVSLNVPDNVPPVRPEPL
jgi:hypothetical protein